MGQIIGDAAKRGVEELFHEHGFDVEIIRGIFRWTKYSKSENFFGRVTIDNGDQLGGAPRYRTVNAAIEHLKTHKVETAKDDGMEFPANVEGIKQAIEWVQKNLDGK
jgi:hypothetical protein